MYFISQFVVHHSRESERAPEQRPWRSSAYRHAPGLLSLFPYHAQEHQPSSGIAHSPIISEENVP